MNVLNAKNPKWSDPTGTKIDIDVNFESIPEEYVPFTCSAGPDHDYAIDLFNRAASGEFGDIAQWDGLQSIDFDEALKILRNKRDSLLAKTDYIENPTYWSRLTPEKQNEWAIYRNALRDITNDTSNLSAHEEVILNDSAYSIITVLDGIEFPVMPE